VRERATQASDIPPEENGAFELWRQDDNGNEFLISTFRSRDEADKARLRLEAKGHKQHYWVTCLE